jgi:trans-aconitate methyltransferase
MYMAALSLLVTLLCPTSVVAVNMVDIIDYTHIVIKDVLNGSYHSSIRQKPNQGKN